MARLFRFALLLALPCGCDLSDELEGEPCDVDDDCWHTQHCARTHAEKQSDLPGVCMPKDVACVTGQQLGCACAPEMYEMNCTNAAVPSAIDYPAMMCDATQLVCVVESSESSSEG
jgi:hypothetical protein